MMVLLGVLFSIALTAQTPVEKKKEEMKDLKKDVVEKREERKEMGKAITHAKFKKAVNERKDVRAEKRHIKRDAARLEKQGVKHPVAKAKHKIHAEKEEKKAKIN